MIKEEEAGTTGAQVRGDIQSGITGDKRPGFDPALAPLETDSEAGGAGLSPEQSDLARTTQRSELEKGPDPSFNSAMRGPERLWARAPRWLWPAAIAATAILALGVFLLLEAS